MNIRMLVLGGLLLAGAPFVSAADPVADPVTATPGTDELKDLIDQVKAKLGTEVKAGHEVTEAQLAPELKAFDALVERHRADGTDLSGQALLLKAMLYLQVFQNIDRAEEILRQVTAEFAATEPGKAAEALIAKLGPQKESMRIQAALAPGSPFPDFESKDLSGAPLSVGQFKGKVVLIDFWATWCGPCVRELPTVQAAYAKYHDKGFEIVGISLDESEADLRKFVAEKNMPWPQSFDGKGWKSALGQKYGINSIPATFLLDREGKIAAKNLRGPQLEAKLAQMLGQ